MKNRKLLFAAFCGAVAFLGLCGCREEVITVADIRESEEQTIEYVEMQEFTLKEKEEESGREEVKHCAVVIPNGYYASDEIPNMYVHHMAPLDSSNVYYSMSEGEEGQVSENLTKQQYEEALKVAYKEKGRDVSVAVESFERVDMDGVPAYKIKSSYAADGNTIQQLTYMILAENTYTVTYSQSADDELMADFEVTDCEIKLVKAEDTQLADAAE